MPDLFSAADLIWQYKFDPSRSNYACASSILFDSFDIFKSATSPDLARTCWNKSNLNQKDELERLSCGEPRLQ